MPWLGQGHGQGQGQGQGHGQGQGQGHGQGQGQGQGHGQGHGHARGKYFWASLINNCIMEVILITGRFWLLGTSKVPSSDSN